MYSPQTEMYVRTSHSLRRSGPCLRFSPTVPPEPDATAHLGGTLLACRQVAHPESAARVVVNHAITTTNAPLPTYCTPHLWWCLCRRCVEGMALWCQSSCAVREPIFCIFLVEIGTGAHSRSIPYIVCLLVA